jgi:hypothetical protein
MKEFLSRITPVQWLGIVVLFNGTVIGGAGYLKDMMIPAAIVTALTAFCAFANMFLGGLITMFGTPINMAKSADQETLIREVLSMPGVQNINVNAKANSTLATLAVDPTVAKIGPTPEAANKVQQTAAQG